ncbi:MAG TPA: putative quinol monooxygenase [Mycobacteriales bacterium]|jgi:quinol monooxygenase YgiN|nr:putative quinol monooxygenase [Mycobacteriales bacterium]
MARPVTLLASFEPTPGGEDKLAALLLWMVGNTRQEPGNQRYDLYRADKGSFHLFEEYADDAALQAHRDADYFKAYRAQVADLIAGPIDVRVLSREEAGE